MKSQNLMCAQKFFDITKSINGQAVSSNLTVPLEPLSIRSYLFLRCLLYIPVTPLSPFGPGLDSFISASCIALLICLLLFVRACITFPLRACWASVIKTLNTYLLCTYYIVSLKKYYLYWSAFAEYSQKNYLLS